MDEKMKDKVNEIVKTVKSSETFSRKIINPEYSGDRKDININLGFRFPLIFEAIGEIIYIQTKWSPYSALKYNKNTEIMVLVYSNELKCYLLLDNNGGTDVDAIIRLSNNDYCDDLMDTKTTNDEAILQEINYFKREMIELPDFKHTINYCLNQSQKERNSDWNSNESVFYRTCIYSLVTRHLEEIDTNLLKWYIDIFTVEKFSERSGYGLKKIINMPNVDREEIIKYIKEKIMDPISWWGDMDDNLTPFIENKKINVRESIL